VLIVYFDAYCVEGAYGFTYAAVGAFLRVDVDCWALGFLSLLFGLFSYFYGFSGACDLADFAAYALCFVQCEFVVFGVQEALYGLLVFVVCFSSFIGIGRPFPYGMLGLFWVENIFTNVNAHKKLAFLR